MQDILLKHVWPHLIKHVQPALRHPAGLAGRIVLKIFNISNAVSIRDAVTRLNLQPEHR